MIEQYAKMSNGLAPDFIRHVEITTQGLDASMVLQAVTREQNTIKNALAML